MYFLKNSRHGLPFLWREARKIFDRTVYVSAHGYEQKRQIGFYRICPFGLLRVYLGFNAVVKRYNLALRFGVEHRVRDDRAVVEYSVAEVSASGIGDVCAKPDGRIKEETADGHSLGVVLGKKSVGHVRLNDVEVALGAGDSLTCDLVHAAAAYDQIYFYTLLRIELIVG